MYDLSLLPPRVLDRIAFDGYSGCWRWTGQVNSEGYAKLRIPGVHAGNGHRAVYLTLVGEVPDGLILDHTCHDRGCRAGVYCPHRRCLFPGHLEPVTNAENLRRGRNVQREKIHCPAGHPYDEANTLVRYLSDGSPRRQCRTCLAQKVAADVAARPLKPCRRCGRAVEGENIGILSTGRRACRVCLPDIEAERSGSRPPRPASWNTGQMRAKRLKQLAKARRRIAALERSFPAQLEAWVDWMIALGIDIEWGEDNWDEWDGVVKKGKF
jgi:hypothetical protein